MRACFRTLREQDGELFQFPLDAAMIEWEINTPMRAAAFCAQIGHESGDLAYWHEIWGPTEAQKRYEPPSDLAVRLGNTQPGDGHRYHGRGPIQLTGRSNYIRFGKLLGIDLVGHPEQAEVPLIGFRLAGAFWQTNDLNRMADLETHTNYRQITKRINGGLNGHADRVRRWAMCRIAFGLAPVEAV